VAHHPGYDEEIYKGLAKIASQFPGVFCNIIYGVKETMVIAHSELAQKIESVFSRHNVLSAHRALSALTMRLPEASMEVPGVYHAVLQALSWSDVNVVEIISVRTELTVICNDTDIEKALRVVRGFSKTSV
jgi:aspartokinase